MTSKARQAFPKLPAIKDMTLEQVINCYNDGGYFNSLRLNEKTIEKRLVERGLAIAKTKADLNGLLQVILQSHESFELMPRIFAQIMPIMKRVEQLSCKERRLEKF